MFLLLLGVLVGFISCMLVFLVWEVMARLVTFWCVFVPYTCRSFFLFFCWMFVFLSFFLIIVIFV